MLKKGTKLLAELRLPDFQPSCVVNQLKMFPKSARYIGTVAACPKCGQRGYLIYAFLADSCTDRLQRHYLTECTRDLSSGHFIVKHDIHRHINGVSKTIRLGQCCFNVKDRGLLDSLLLYGKHISDNVTERTFKADVYGFGVSDRGLRIFEGKPKLSQPRKPPRVFSRRCAWPKCKKLFKAVNPRARCCCHNHRVYYYRLTHKEVKRKCHGLT